jgi:hypothetical protein
MRLAVRGIFFGQTPMRVRRLDPYGDWTFGHGRSNYADHTESTEQRTGCRLLSFRGDWFLDLTHGMPWLDDFEKPGNLPDIERAARMMILQTSGIAQLDELDLVLTPDRHLTITAAVTTTDDDDLNLVVENNGPANS